MTVDPRRVASFADLLRRVQELEAEAAEREESFALALGDAALDADRTLAREKADAAAQIEALEEQVRGLKETVTVTTSAQEEKQAVARRQRRLADAQQAEVAAAVQAKLVAAAEREEALRERVAELE